ncbi:MAG: hypothetical protein MJK04_27345 [Psychrosphaera sp.]|nr:hypothetical protein [Psychrosphaera sp.]
MKTLHSLFSDYPETVEQRFYQRALNIQIRLKQGVHYQNLGGRRLMLCHELIRFKLGSYRLLFTRSGKGFTPEFLVQRKNLEKFLKRRCGH